MDCSLPGSSVHGICQARVLEWVAIYMESRKMVLMELFAGQQCRHRHREQTYGRGWRVGGKERVGYMEKVTWKLILPYVK